MTKAAHRFVDHWLVDPIAKRAGVATLDVEGSQVAAVAWRDGEVAARAAWEAGANPGVGDPARMILPALIDLHAHARERAAGIALAMAGERANQGAVIEPVLAHLRIRTATEDLLVGEQHAEQFAFRTGNLAALFGVLRRPEVDFFVAPAGIDGLSVCRVSDAGDGRIVAQIAGFEVTRVEVEHARGPVAAGGDHLFAVGRKGE